jgi:cytidine deaminase
MAPALLSLSSPHPASLASISPTELSTLSRLAADAKARAYCPYSKFRVGAAVLVGPPPKKSESASDTAAAAAATADDGVAANNTVIIGANVENAAYPVGVCAERTALSHAVVEGHRGSFRAIAVSTDISPPASPCGMCRQLCV